MTAVSRLDLGRDDSASARKHLCHGLLATIGIGALAFALAGCGEGGDPDPEPPSPSDVSARDLIYYERVKEDLSQLFRMVRIRPDDPELRVKLGITLRAGMLTDEAEAEFEKALELQPGHEEAADLLFQMRFDRGDLDGARRVLQAALEDHESSRLKAREARYLAHARPDQPELAIAAYRRALELESLNMDAAFELSRLLSQTGALDEAAELLRTVVRLKPNHLGGQYTLAMVLRRLGKPEEAAQVSATHKRLAHLDDLGHLEDFESPEASLALAYMYRSGSDDASALSELETARRRYPRHAEVLTEYAMALLRVGRRDDAIAAFDDGLRRAPGDANLMNRYAWLLATRSTDKQDLRRALTLAEQAVTASGRRDPNILDTLAEARAALGNYAAAVAALREALRLKPGDPVLTRRLEQFRGQQEKQ